jgi:hypothetical protein
MILMSYFPMRANQHALVRGYGYWNGIMRYVDSTQRQRVASRINPASWAVVWLGAVVGKVDNRDSHYYRYYRVAQVVAIAGNGKYLQLSTLEGGSTYWAHACLYYRMADNVNEYQLQRKVEELEAQLKQNTAEIEAQQRAKLRTLSANTVTRALVHAHDHDYCSETAMALISAGHKLPDVTLNLQVTVDVTVTLEGKRNYYPLRKLFGETRGEVDGAYGIHAVEHSDTVYSMIQEQLSSGDINFDTVTHTGTDVEWFDPALRLMNDSEARIAVEDQNNDY